MTKETILVALSTSELVSLHNEYCEDNSLMDDYIYTFDEETINELFSNPWDALRAAHFGDISFNQDYFRFNGYGNIETLSDYEIESDLDWEAVSDWLEENPDKAFGYGLEYEEDEEDEEDTRTRILDYLQNNDPNGCYTDDLTEEPLTLAQAVANLDYYGAGGEARTDFENEMLERVKDWYTPGDYEKYIVV